MSAPIRLYWWSPVRDFRVLAHEFRRNGEAWATMTRSGGRPMVNFGDELSAEIVARVTGRRVRWAPPSRADVVAIGSVLEHLAGSDGSANVWGTGLRTPTAAARAWASATSARVLAVRGALTRDALGLPASVTLGEPGLLIRAAAPPPARRRTGILVIPHFLAFGDRETRRQLVEARRAGMRVAPPSLGHAAIQQEIARSDLVLTSSLHGMVLADALARPVRFVAFGRSDEPAFKFADYHSAFGDSAPTPTRFIDLVRDRTALELAFASASERRDRVNGPIDAVVDALARSGEDLRELL